MKAIGCPLNLNPGNPDIPLHGFKIAPATDFLNLDRRNSIPDELCCETRSQRMELNKGKANVCGEMARPSGQFRNLHS